MMKKYIPIIGTISAGKSTFLKGLLGTNVLESGATTTTKFVCLIKNSSQTKLYHVIPKKEKYLEFIKEGEETFGEEKIKEKIKDINKTLSEKPGTKNEIFYILETPIKNIENNSLLDECIFMDIPGLNENESSYLNIIFPLFTLDEIKFEIIVFDSNNIDSDTITNIIKKLGKINCLKKTGNLFILNKIDKISENGEKEIIDKFKDYFYRNFEDDKNETSVMINISQNKFIPMNSLLLLAESRINDDFYSMLLVEFFNYLESKDKGQINSFYDYIKQILEFTNKHLKEQNKKIKLDVKITNKEWEIIEKSVKDIEAFKKKDKRGIINIKLSQKSVKNNMINLFLIHKNKCNFYNKLKYYDEIKKYINEITINNNLPLQSSPINNLNTKKDGNKKLNYIDALNELENFFNDTLNRIDPHNELKSFKDSLESLKDSIIKRKIRIGFFGNISVGKSTVLNSIIGENILPTNDTECTYRGIIIRHVHEDVFKLYKTKPVIKEGKENVEYTYFEDEKEPYKIGVENINSYLINKNNDKIIQDKDAFLVITGNLKVFDFIKLDEEIISKIEFIDLPGQDRENNNFIKDGHLKKIMRFINCCIYINEPKTIDDESSMDMITKQYWSNKQKIYPVLRENFINTCLFLINKIDEIEEEEEKKKLEDNIFKNISKVEKEKELKRKDVNISFFSGKLFLKFLKVYKDYVDLVEKNPELLIFNLYKRYINKTGYFLFRSFKSYITNKISKIGENFLEGELEEVEPPTNFKVNLKTIINHLIKKVRYNILYQDDIEEVIQKLYNLYKNLKENKSLNGPYSSIFFNDLKKVILNAYKLNKDIFNSNVQSFLKETDDLFRKELEKETEELKIKKEKEQKELEIIKPLIKETFDKTKEIIKKIYEEGRAKLKEIIEDEINNISDRLKDANKDLKIATETLKTKIDAVNEEINTRLKNVFSSLVEEMEKRIKKKFEEKEIKMSANSNIDTNKGLTVKMVLSLIASTITGIGVRTGLVFIGQYVLAGAAAGAATSTLGLAAAGAIVGPVGIAVGVGIGLAISATTFLVHLFSKEKRYKKGLEEFLNKMEQDMKESEINCLDDFEVFENEFNKAYEQKLSVIKKDISNVNEDEWEELKLKYAEQKNKILKIIEAID